jgi:hypothetical protein
VIGYLLVRWPEAVAAQTTKVYAAAPMAGPGAATGNYLPLAAVTKELWENSRYLYNY